MDTGVKYTLRSFVPMVLPFGKLRAGRTRIFMDARLSKSGAPQNFFGVTPQEVFGASATGQPTQKQRRVYAGKCLLSII